jgi:hypothetical protein
METSHESDSSIPVGTPDRYVAKKQMEICVYTTTYILMGYIYCLQQQRLLDLLNSVTVGALRVDTDFLPITEATSYTPDEAKTATQFALINKAKILFANETEQQKEPGTKANHSLRPAIGKALVTATLHIPPYALSGQMHCAKGQRLSDLLNTKDMFLPVTNVDIVSSSGIRQSVAFAAVNKTQIIYAEEHRHK